jgi:hypothetical protein
MFLAIEKAELRAFKEESVNLFEEFGKGEG